MQKKRIQFSGLALALLVIFLSACQDAPLPIAKATQPTLAEQLIFYDWEGDLPQSVLDAFQDEFGVEVVYKTYESQEEAIETMRAGELYDVVVMDSRFVPALTQEGLLAKLNLANIPNFKNISPNFRDLSYDPGNRYTIPFNWGTTGIIARRDLLAGPLARWADLWDAPYAGKIGLWRGQPREVIGLTLHMLGYSANTEDPAALEAALDRLMVLRPHVRFIEDLDPETSAYALASGELTLALGFSGDFLIGRELSQDIMYILPSEGTVLWGDSFVIPANSLNRATAEVFLNFLLRPEVSAQIANENYYATPNQAAWPLIATEIFNDPVVFPPNEDLQHAEIILPLSPEVQKLYDEAWEQFLLGAD